MSIDICASVGCPRFEASIDVSAREDSRITTSAPDSEGLHSSDRLNGLTAPAVHRRSGLRRHGGKRYRNFQSRRHIARPVVQIYSPFDKLCKVIVALSLSGKLYTSALSFSNASSSASTTAFASRKRLSRPVDRDCPFVEPAQRYRTGHPLPPQLLLLIALRKTGAASVPLDATVH